MQSLKFEVHLNFKFNFQLHNGIYVKAFGISRNVCLVMIYLVNFWCDCWLRHMLKHMERISAWCSKFIEMHKQKYVSLYVLSLSSNKADRFLWPLYLPLCFPFDTNGEWWTLCFVVVCTRIRVRNRNFCELNVASSWYTKIKTQRNVYSAKISNALPAGLEKLHGFSKKM